MVDVPASTATTATIAVGGTANNSLEAVGDHDWFRIQLTAGQAISVTVNGVTLDDPILRIRDLNGNILFQNDDGGPGLNSFLAFQASYTGAYYIDVGSAPENQTGSYELSVTPFSPPPLGTIDEMANWMTDGFWDGDRHHFDVTQGGTITVNLTALPADSASVARAALDLWSDIIGVTFTEVASGGQIVFGDADEGTGAFSDGVWANGITSSATVNVSTARLGTGPGIVRVGLQTYIHEIGHALGLGHTGDYNGGTATSRYPYEAKFLNDSSAVSIMSYFDNGESSYYAAKGFTNNLVVTPQIADIMAVASLYGLSTTTRTGDTTYGFNNNSGREVFDASLHPNVAYTIFDSGGVDTLDYSGFANNQKIDLNPGAFSNVGSSVGNVVIAYGTFIENAVGGSGADTIIGNDFDNDLSGNAGNDSLSGGLGDDILRGGNGNDTISGDSGFWDTLIGGAGVDNLDGGAGNDRYIINAASEHSAAEFHDSGSSGTDYVFFDAPTGTLSLFAGDTGIDQAYLSNDSFDLSTAPTNIDASAYVGDIALIGNAGNNQLIGNGARNFLDGSAGNDILISGDGNDSLDGGTGDDQLYGGAGDEFYDVDSVGDQVFEAVGGGHDWVNTHATYTLTPGQEIEVVSAVDGGGAINLTGNEFANEIYGNSDANVLRGGGGNDGISGYGGNDTLKGEGGDDGLQGLDGDDILLGGDGNDLLGGGAGYDKMYGGVGDDSYDVNDATDFAYENVGEGHDRVMAWIDHTLRSNIEDLYLLDGAVIGKGNALDNGIAGDNVNNKLYGLDGDDHLNGAGGDDWLLGGNGNDVMSGDDGVDRAYGGLGDDLYYVTDATDYTFENVGEGNDRVVSFIDLVLRPNIEELELGASAIRAYGNELDNLVLGNFADNLLHGRDGDDTIRGNIGNDIVYGENGNDTLEGGAGSDRFYGGSGRDKFVFRNGDFGGMTSGTADRIHDFSEADRDLIHLSNVDANEMIAGDQAFSFIGSAAFGQHAGELRAYQLNGVTWVQGDTDGDGTADFLIRVDGLHTLTAADFVL